MDEEPNPRLKTAILEVVERQLAENNPPQVREVLHRLQAAGATRGQAIERIGAALAEEIWHVLHEAKPHDPVRYAELLRDVK